MYQNKIIHKSIKYLIVSLLEIKKEFEKIFKTKSLYY
jgi:hypothetical protein